MSITSLCFLRSYLHYRRNGTCKGLNDPDIWKNINAMQIANEWLTKSTQKSVKNLIKSFLAYHGHTRMLQLKSLTVLVQSSINELQTAMLRGGRIVRKSPTFKKKDVKAQEVKQPRIPRRKLGLEVSKLRIVKMSDKMKSADFKTVAVYSTTGTPIRELNLVQSDIDDECECSMPVFLKGLRLNVNFFYRVQMNSFHYSDGRIGKVSINMSRNLIETLWMVELLYLISDKPSRLSEMMLLGNARSFFELSTSVYSLFYICNNPYEYFVMFMQWTLYFDSYWKEDSKRKRQGIQHEHIVRRLEYVDSAIGLLNSMLLDVPIETDPVMRDHSFASHALLKDIFNRQSSLSATDSKSIRDVVFLSSTPPRECNDLAIVKESLLDDVFRRRWEQNSQENKELDEAFEIFDNIMLQCDL